MKSRFIKSALLAVSLLAPTFTLRAQDMPAGPWAGAWNFIPAKSTYPGPPPSVDQVAIDPDGTVTVNEINAEGKHLHWHYKPQEGQAVPVIGRGDNITVLVKKVNDRRTEHSWNFNGRTAKSYSTLSEDGKIQTFHIDGTDKDGKPYHETVVYERQ